MIILFYMHYKKYREMEIKIHAFLNSAIDGVGWRRMGKLHAPAAL
jgi:hypothetical protein